MPIDWRWYVHRHPSLDDVPDITLTGSGIPGDPLNVALIGTESEVKQIMQAAGWKAADPLGLRSDLEIAADTVLKRPDDQAPVSSLYLFGRKEDLAFEQPVGSSPRKRNHVRFWRTDKVDDGRPDVDRVGDVRRTGRIQPHDRPNHAPHRGRRRCRAGPSVSGLAGDRRLVGDVLRGRFSQDPGRPKRRRRPLAHRRAPRSGSDRPQAEKQSTSAWHSRRVCPFCR